MSKLDTVRALILLAGHEDTGIDEARAAALQAVKLITKHDFVVVEEECFETCCKPPKEDESQETQFPGDFDVPEYFNADAFEEVVTFTLKVAQYRMQCVKCQKEIRKGVPYAQEAQTKTPKVTHYECRSYFTEGK